MKNILILLCLLLTENPLYAQRWSSAFVGKPESRAIYASNVAKAIQNAWENELSSRDKKEMLLDEIIFGQETEKKVTDEHETNKIPVSNIDEIEEVLGIKENEIDPVKKKKIDNSVSVSTPTKNVESTQNRVISTTAMGNIDEVKEATENLKQDFDVPEKRASTYLDKKTTLTINNDDIEVDTIYAIPEVSAIFPGGLNALKHFFAKNITSPENIGQTIKGKVFIRFMVSTAGELSKIYVIKGLIDACNQEALRVVKKMPTWIPATQEGKKVNSWYTLPIYFELD
ncbi:MAG: energy transducer TonB [Bacteroidota bacterium]